MMYVCTMNEKEIILWIEILKELQPFLKSATIDIEYIVRQSEDFNALLKKYKIKSAN